MKKPRGLPGLFDGLEPPVIDRRGDLVSAVQIDLGQLEVVADHIEGGVAKDALEGECVAAVAQESDGEGMPETVRMAVGHPGALTGSVEQLEELGAIERAAGVGDEEGSLDRFPFAGDQVLEDSFAGAGRNGDDALTIAFAEGEHIPVAQVHIDDFEAAQLGGAQAGIEQEQDDGAVAVGVGQLVAGLFNQ